VVTRPRFVVADEPVSALDATIQAQVLALFQALQAQYGFACLFITHDLGVVAQIADRVIVMRDGRIVEEGARDAVLDRPQDPYTRELLAATPSLAAHAGRTPP
jgi:peptide/nickel transport system ATP-binding protein